MKNFYLVLITLMLPFAFIHAQCSLNINSNPPTCHNGNDGAAVVLVANGEAPFTIELDQDAPYTNPTSNFLLMDLAPGAHNLTVTDALTIYLRNGGGVPMDGTVTFVHPEPQDYTSSIPVETSYDLTNHTVTWDYSDLLPGKLRKYRVELYTPLSLNLGDNLTYEFSADPIVDDVNPEDNTLTCVETVTGSYDPNDKAVIPAGIGEEGVISMADSILNYRVRFQNTGTDTAFTVLIRDTLDLDLDVRTIVPGPSSHAYSASIKDGNVLELLFENILLPDSFVNEPASNGHVFFDIKVKPNRAEGTRIENTAAIYFDFNEPVITNRVVNTIQMISSTTVVDENPIQMKLSPNPMSAISTLTYTLEDAESITINLYDLLGNKIKVLQAKTNQFAGEHSLMIKDLDIFTGIYFVMIKTGNGELTTLKLIKMN